MSFTGTYSETNLSTTAYNAFKIADTSDFSDEPKSDFSGRRVYLVNVDGTYISPESQEIIILGVAPRATITIDSVPADGYNIIVALPASMGSTALGSYTKQSSDTDTTILAASIAGALSGSGVTITSALNVVTIVFEVETSDYNGESLDITSNDVAGVSAVANLYVGGSPLGQSAGTQFNMYAVQPDDTELFLATYIKQSGDTTESILASSLNAALNGNTEGYVSVANVSGAGEINLTAPISLGATINGKDFKLYWGFSSTSAPFGNGVSAAAVIPNTPTDFTGGVTAGTETVTGLDYWDFGFDSYPTDEITINTLQDLDVALNIYVQWIPITPVSGSTYSASGVYEFKDNAEAFMFNKILQLSANRTLWSSKNFRTTLSAARSMIDSSTTCVVYQDQYGSQVCLDFAEEVENNPNLFY